MKITPSPLVRVQRPVRDNQGVEGLDKLLESGDICSYSRADDQLVVFARTPEGARKVEELELQPPRSGQALSKRVREFLTPTGQVAPEYAKFRGWSLAGSLLGGVLGFMTTAVYLDSLKAAFSTSEQAAMAGVITGSIGKVTQMGGWALSQVGDNDPKRGFLTSGLVSSLNSIVGLGLLAVAPKAHLPLYCVTSLTGTLSGIVGSAAGVNIFNHMAPGPNKGEVATKNGNQDMVAGFFGMPGGLLMARAARALNWNPAVLAACTLGPALLYTTVQAARSIQLEPMGRGQLERAVDSYLAHGQLPQVEKKGFLATLGDLFRSRPAEEPSTIRWAERLEDVADVRTDFTLFKNEKYLLNQREGQVRVCFKAGAGAEDAVRATIHARLVQQGASVAEAMPSVPRGLGEELAHKGWRMTPSSLRMPTIRGSW